MRTPRPYQSACHGAIRDAFRNGLKRVLVELATGLGKTVIFVLMTMMTRAKGGRVLILVNRDVLVTQALDELQANGVFAAREQAEARATLTSEVVCASVQSLQGKWLERWPRDYFKLVITDECHGSAAATFRKILDHFEGAYHVGVTATAERHDKRGLWKGYEDIVYRMPLKNWVDKTSGEVTRGGIDEGWLCDFKFIDLDCPVTLDERLATHAVFKENEEVFDSAKYLPRLAECAIAEATGKKGLFFLPNCRVSNEFATMLKARGLNAEHIDSSYMTPARTSELLEWFKWQKSGILCNSDLLSVGYNQPDIDCIGLFRPIASTPMYKQRLGRGTRPVAKVDDYATAEERIAAIADSAKPACTVLNVFWENDTHNLASPSCLITDDEDERKAIDKDRKAGSQVDLDKLEERLKAKRMEDQAEEMRKFAEKVANSQAKKHRGKVWIDDILKHRNPNHKPASDAFVRFVRKMGADIPTGDYSAYQIMRVKERLEKSRR